MPWKEWLLLHGICTCICIPPPRGAIRSVYLLTRVMPRAVWPRAVWPRVCFRRRCTGVRWMIPARATPDPDPLQPAPPLPGRPPRCKTQRQIGKKFPNLGRGPMSPTARWQLADRDDRGLWHGDAPWWGLTCCPCPPISPSDLPQLRDASPQTTSHPGTLDFGTAPTCPPRL